MIYRCCDQLRRDKVAAQGKLNGIDYLEVIDRELPALDPLRQRTLFVHCLRPIPNNFTRSNVVLQGGERVKNIKIEWALPAAPMPAQLGKPAEAAVAACVTALKDAGNVLIVRVAEPGDYSTYTLSLVRSAIDANPPADFDPQLDSIDFSFKVECPSDFDCRPLRICPPAAGTAPEIDYLAKDYASFRRLMLDRMTQLAPQWQQTSVADYGIALVELLAYVGDQLSYQQDAIATEAYLETARRRVSLRRHALLVDYLMHDGCNARAWVQIELAAGAASLTLAQGATQFLTRCTGFAPGIASGSNDLREAMMLLPAVFEPLHAPTLYEAHNKISFYTWTDTSCCLPRGATGATLAGHLDKLKVGDVLLFEEMLGPRTGAPGDADPNHRHVVRLTKVDCTDPENAANPRKDPFSGDLVTEIAWGRDDALPFALCISGTTDAAHGAKYLPAISVARGNLILVDHGRTISGEALGRVPAPVLFQAPGCDGDFCAPAEPVPIPPRYRPQLALAPLTQAGTVLVQSAVDDQAARLSFDPTAPATQALSWSMADVRPQIALSTPGQLNNWQPQRTLLNSGASATEFVVEVDDGGGASLRFGDDEHGQRPQTGTAFTAGYRIGNGSAGNVGFEAIAHVVASPADINKIAGVRNPLPAAGGIDPETAASVRRNAPEAFRTQERAVTTDDYAAVTERRDGVQRAAATLRWTGSWYTVFITVDPDADADSTSIKQSLPSFVDPYRMAGHDLEFNDPRYVSLEVDMHVCVQPDYFRSDVKAGLIEQFSDRDLPDGRRGLFHPDNFSFGQTVYLSPLYAAAHAVAGVASVEITKFQRQGTDDATYLAQGELPLGRLEIARLANNLNFPERGVLRLDLNGGK